MARGINLKARQVWLPALGGLLLAVAGFLLTHGLRRAMDIFFLDETGYLTRGLNMFPKIPKLWGPVYCFWYKVLSFFQSDPVSLFYLNFGLMAVAVGVTLYLFLLRFRVFWPVALWLALLIMISPVNMTTFPRVSHFTTVAAMAALMTAYGIRHNLNRYVFIALAFLVLAYVRPEFYLSFIATAVGLAGLVASGRVKAQPTLLVLGGILLAALLHIGLGFPLGVELRGYKRSFIAFGEHFAYNFSLWNHLDGYFWLVWEDVVGDHFGDSRSFSEALLANPAMMMRHFASNAANYALLLGETLASALVPVKSPPAWAGLLAPALFGASLFSPGIRTAFFGRMQHHRALLLFLALLALPSILSCVVIFPRDHYLINQLPLLAWLLAEWLSAVLRELLPGKRLRVAGFAVLAATVVLIAFPRTPADYAYFELRKEEGRLNNLTVIRMLDGNSEKLEGVKLLSHEGDFTAFTKAGIRFLNAIEKGKRPFREFLEEADPQIIYCTKTIFMNPDYRNDETWLDFTEGGGSERQGWIRMDVGGGPYDFLLVRQQVYELLNP